MKNTITLLFTLSLLLVTSLPAKAVVQYTVTDLGSLGGTASYAYGINDNGQVVGGAYISGNYYWHAFLWQNGSGMQDLGTLGGTFSTAESINNNGQVVGSALITGNNDWHPFLWQNDSGMQDLGTLGGTYSKAFGINDNGQVVGTSFINGNIEHAFLWQSGKGMRDLGSLVDGGGSIALGINDSGQVVGEAQTSINLWQAFLWQSGSGMRKLTTATYYDSCAEDINNSGQSVGDVEDRAVLWPSSGSNMGLAAWASSHAYGINNSGYVVGYYYTVGNHFQHAFIFSDWTMTDLNTLIDSSSGWILQNAQAINDLGQIVGWGSNNSGQTHAFLLTPIPEPSVFVLLGIGAIGMLAYAWRHQN